MSFNLVPLSSEFCKNTLGSSISDIYFQWRDWHRHHSVGIDGAVKDLPIFVGEPYENNERLYYVHSLKNLHVPEDKCFRTTDKIRKFYPHLAEESDEYYRQKYSDKTVEDNEVLSIALKRFEKELDKFKFSGEWSKIMSPVGFSGKEKRQVELYYVLFKDKEPLALVLYDPDYNQIGELFFSPTGNWNEILFELIRDVRSRRLWSWLKIDSQKMLHHPWLEYQLSTNYAAFVGRYKDEDYDGKTIWYLQGGTYAGMFKFQHNVEFYIYGNPVHRTRAEIVQCEKIMMWNKEERKEHLITPEKQGRHYSKDKVPIKFPYLRLIFETPCLSYLPGTDDHCFNLTIDDIKYAPCGCLVTEKEINEKIIPQSKPPHKCHLGLFDCCSKAHNTRRILKYETEEISVGDMLSFIYSIDVPLNIKEIDDKLYATSTSDIYQFPVCYPMVRDFSNFLKQFPITKMKEEPELRRCEFRSVTSSLIEEPSAAAAPPSSVSYIYLFQKHESLRCGDNVYKIGRTTVELGKEITRFKAADYRGGCEEYKERCENVTKVEAEIKKRFREKFGAPVEGTEMFHGDCELMKKIIHEVVTEMGR